MENYANDPTKLAKKQADKVLEREERERKWKKNNQMVAEEQNRKLMNHKPNKKSTTANPDKFRPKEVSPFDQHYKLKYGQDNDTRNSNEKKQDKSKEAHKQKQDKTHDSNKRKQAQQKHQDKQIKSRIRSIGR